MLYFSADTGGFYDSDLHGDAIPDDAVTIRPARHRQLLEAQARGRRICVSKSGRPVIARAKKAD